MFYAASLLGISGLLLSCPKDNSFNEPNNLNRTQVKINETKSPRLINESSSGIFTEVSILQSTATTGKTRFEFRFTAPETGHYYLGYEKNIKSDNPEEGPVLVKKQLSLSYKLVGSDENYLSEITFDNFSHPLLSKSSNDSSIVVGYSDLNTSDVDKLDYSTLEIINIFKTDEAYKDIETDEETGEWINFNSIIDAQNIKKGQIYSLSASIGQITNTVTSASVEISFEYNSVINPFFIGYGIDTNGVVEEYKATLNYYVETENNNKELRNSSIQRKNTNDFYDPIGAIGNNSFRTYCDIPLEPGENLLTDVFYISNIFGGYKSETDNKFYVSLNAENKLESLTVTCGKTTKHKNFSLDNFVSFSYLGSSSFNGFGTVSFRCENKVTREFYRTLITNKLYNDNSDYLDDGTAYIRTRLNLNTDTLYYFYYEGLDEPVVYQTTSQYENVTNDANIELLFENLNVTNLINVTISNYSVVVDMFNNEKVLQIKQSNYSARFANTELGFKEIKSGDKVYVSKNPNSFIFNIDLFMIISFIVLVIIYESISTFAFFYLKNKYKNDEFKRVRPKQYWKTNTIGLFTSTCILFMLESIIFRSTIWNNTIPVYNSMDILICIFTVASIIMGGYFIRYFAIQIKNIRDVIRDEKSKRRDSSLDEGTLIIPTAKGE